MDTLIFMFLAACFFLVIRKARRTQVLIAWTVSLVFMVVLFAIHVSDPLELNF